MPAAAGTDMVVEIVEIVETAGRLEPDELFVEVHAVHATREGPATD